MKIRQESEFVCLLMEGMELESGCLSVWERNVYTLKEY